MVIINVVPYSLRILKDSEKKKDSKPIKYENLNDINFKDLFLKFLKENINIRIDEKNEKIFSTSSNYKYDKKLDCYYGEIYSGNYGYSRNVVNVKTKKRINELKPNEAEEIKYFFVLKIINNRALLLLSTFKSFGIKEQVNTQLKKFIKSEKIFSENFDLKMNIFVSNKLFDLNEFPEIVFIENRKEKDIESSILDELENDGETLIKEKRSISMVKRNSFFNKKIINKINNEYLTNRYIEYEGIKYHKVKLIGKTKSGKQKSIKIDGNFNINERQEIEFEGDFPDLETFFKEVKSYLLHIKKEHFDGKW